MKPEIAARLLQKTDPAVEAKSAAPADILAAHTENMRLLGLCKSHLDDLIDRLLSPP